ncbi:uncharacterized protein C18orf63 homolog isoform X2 [Podarcis raffonei]|uniref:uncharacterized protein C18orf63 homolog isoform X2 n=1 Tax=Podarcis raffonei TaxID=65483 RepID=UPI0023296E7C|nr:uncharacterized protein C18orf63 homolog isoform X2 [Podarcis raffonei]XP_053252618.1 uncharacterized protein C18orf63 homolog isoform X2 [Podarcis raffonei]XP_053252620.1 uncharacterized protein C18orf63 homolog isoform X2 [Podarcis raffonei]XP_053252621.1 uncharacterized protein C18orf63 homolog isoform X2 [Podarcis raffonei]XP_053252622.1 uncharacterized protein C18orf63 homolog isoform X2 [Podarcis raffonei]XP_053252623.1 uncharacterized protein C18orf63 homolog isoform X2 [Podarcis raf
MNDVTCQSLFFISLPELRKLCAVKVTLNSQLAATEIRTAQRKMCRQLLHLHQDVLSSPVPGTLNQISVVMTILFYKSGKFQAYIEKNRSIMAMPERVVPAVFQTCLSYTLIAKLAPNWNQAGHLLIQGKDFLSQRGKQNAVVMDINVSETQLCISVEVFTVRLPPPELEEFNISANILKKFDSDNNAIIQKYSILSNWCYVLPSMKMGQIISISHIIPPDTPFQSYSDLQLHWENLYGYILPEDPGIYCNVYFKLIGEQQLRYPFSCIRSQPVQYFPRVDLEGVLSAFVADLKTVIPHICGLPLKMISKALYATKDLTQSSVQKVSSKPANLTGKRNCKVSLTQVIPKKGMLSPSACAIENSHKMELKVNQPKTDIFTNLSLLAEDKNTGVPGRKLYSRKQEKTSEESAGMLNSNVSFKMSNNTLRNYSTRIIPIFKGKLLQMDKQTTKATHEKKRQNASKVMNTAAKLAVFKPSTDQVNKLLRDASLKNTTNGSALQIQTGKANVKSTKLALKEKNENYGHLANYALANGAVLDRDSSKFKSIRLNSSLKSPSNLAVHHVSVVHQHLNTPSNFTTSQNTLTTESKKSHPCVSHSDVDEGNPRIFHNQIQSSAEEEKMNAYSLCSSVHRRAKQGDHKESLGISQQDTIKTTSHHLQGNGLQVYQVIKVPKTNKSSHCKDTNSVQILSKMETHLASASNRSGKRQQLKEKQVSYSKPKKLRTSKLSN